MIVGVPKEVAAGERRVALVPDSVGALGKLGLEVVVESGAGEAAGFLDAEYEAQGARLVAGADEVLGADLVLKVQAPSPGEIEKLKPNAFYMSLMRPLDQEDLTQGLAARGVTAFGMELMPRIFGFV